MYVDVGTCGQIQITLTTTADGGLRIVASVETPFRGSEGWTTVRSEVGSWSVDHGQDLSGINKALRKRLGAFMPPPPPGRKKAKRAKKGPKVPPEEVVRALEKDPHLLWEVSILLAEHKVLGPWKTAGGANKWARFRGNRKSGPLVIVRTDGRKVEVAYRIKGGMGGFPICTTWEQATELADKAYESDGWVLL